MRRKEVSGGLIAAAAILAAFLLPVTFPELSANGLTVGWGIAAFIFIVGIWLALPPRVPRLSVTSKDQGDYQPPAEGKPVQPSNDLIPLRRAPMAQNPYKTVDQMLRDLQDLIHEGQLIQANFMAHDDADTIKTAQIAWSNRVVIYLREFIGLAQAMQFDLIDADPEKGRPQGRSKVGGYHWAIIAARTQFLANLMARLPYSTS